MLAEVLGKYILKDVAVELALKNEMVVEVGCQAFEAEGLTMS